MDMNKARRLVQLNTEKREIEAWLNEVKQQIAEIEEDVLEDMAEDGVDKITVDNYTLYPRRDVYPSPVDQQQAIETLREHGLDDFVETKVATQRFRGWWSEQEKEGAIPEDVAEAFSLNERYRVGATKAKRK